MMELILFLGKTVGISLSGVLAPGAVTTATVAHGARNRWAGVLISIGHGMIEIPLIFLIMLGLGVLFKADWFKIVVGWIGGGFLIWMGIGMLREISKLDSGQHKRYTTGPTMTGVLLSISNPYFLLWWASVGLNLTLEAKQLGWLAFVLFALVHWSCDLVWLTILSLGSFHGTNLLGQGSQKLILQICGPVMIGFGIHFIYKATMVWLGL
ncbi:MAG: LysE family transporter [Sedimentisphaerales bacterium]|nr:LysE family transporter [Sedimentisphaerales bacterium]